MGAAARLRAEAFRDIFKNTRPGVAPLRKTLKWPQASGKAGRGMLFGISFTARPGKEAEVEAVLSDRLLVRRALELMGAQLDCVLAQGNRFTLLYEFEGADAAQARERVLAAWQEAEVQGALRGLAPLVSDPFDPDDPTSFAAFVQRHKVRVLGEAHAGDASPGAAKPSSGRAPIGVAPR